MVKQEGRCTVVFFKEHAPGTKDESVAFEVAPEMWEQMVGSCLVMADNAEHLPPEWKVVKL